MKPGFNPRRFNLGAYNKGRTMPFEERYMPEPMSGCWIWTGSTNKHGYGQIKRNGKDIGAHRVAWEMAHGHSPGAYMVCHSCDNPPCVNPDHLFLGDAASNVADKMAKGRHRSSRGEKHGAAKLTSEEVIAIRSDKRPQSHIAKTYGVSTTLISHIKSRIAWRHLP